MTTAEVNAAIAKAKGWVRYSDVAKPPYTDPTRRPWKWVDAENEEFRGDPTDDPREWSRLLEELPLPELWRCSDSGRWACRFHAATAETQNGDTLGEAVCRAYLAWMGVYDA